MVKQTDLRKTLENLAECMRERRKALGLTQERLAERAGLSVNFVAQLEICDKTPSLRTLAALAVALETDISDLFAHSSQEKWTDENCIILRSLQDMRECDVRFVLDQVRVLVEYLKWQRGS